MEKTMRWKTSYSVLLWAVGLGLYLHDRWVEWMKGITFMGRIHGFDIGVVLMVVGFISLTLKYRVLVRKSGNRG